MLNKGAPPIEAYTNTIATAVKHMANKTRWDINYSPPIWWLMKGLVASDESDSTSKLLSCPRPAFSASLQIGEKLCSVDQP